jgi:hypothetical protein
VNAGEAVRLQQSARVSEHEALRFDFEEHHGTSRPDTTMGRSSSRSVVSINALRMMTGTDTL